MSSLTSLPPLDAPCVKCGGEAFDFTWIAAADNANLERTVQLPYVEAREHLSVVCKACGFVWPAKPLDAKERP